MMTRSTYQFLGAVVALGVLMGTGCLPDVSMLEGGRITKVVHSWPDGTAISTDAQFIAALIQAIASAHEDNTLYDIAMQQRLDFFADDTKVATIVAAGSLFRFRSKGYVSGHFDVLLQQLERHPDTPHNTSESIRQPADGLPKPSM